MTGNAFRLPENIRGLLKKPYGLLYKGDGPEVVALFRDELESAPFIIAVGDVTTANLIEAGVFPDLCLVDRLTKRSPVSQNVSEKTQHDVYDDIFIKNPAGFITEELIDAMEKGIATGRRIRINVDGEEDLATIPAIALCGIGTAVLYGQPDEGLVLVKVTDEKKAEMTALLKEITNQNERSAA